MAEFDKNTTMGELISNGLIFHEDGRHPITDSLYMTHIPSEINDKSALVKLVYVMPLTREFMSQFVIPESNPVYLTGYGVESFEVSNNCREYLRDHFAESVMVAYTYDTDDLREIPLEVKVDQFYPIGCPNYRDKIDSAIFFEFSIDVPNFEMQTYDKILRVLSPLVNQWGHFEKNKVKIFQRLLNDSENHNSPLDKRKSPFENWISDRFK